MAAVCLVRKDYLSKVQKEQMLRRGGKKKAMENSSLNAIKFASLWEDEQKKHASRSRTRRCHGNGPFGDRGTMLADGVWRRWSSVATDKYIYT